MIPPEVKHYFSNGSHAVRKIETQKPYTLIVHFDDGEIRYVNMEHELTGIMSILKDEAIFQTAHTKNGKSIVWDTPDGEIDIDKDNIYIYGEKISEIKVAEPAREYNPM